MQKLYSILLASVLSLFLIGCSDKVNEIKEAVSGINSAANKAATAISQDVHSIRAIEITHNNQTFTVNDLFKSILRDVQWHYEPSHEENILKITGTWQPNLFASYNIDEMIKSDLAVNGRVTIELKVEENIIQEENTTATLTYNEENLLSETGQEILHYFYEYYTTK